MLPTPRHHKNANCLQAYAQELKKVLHEVQVEPGEVEERLQQGPSTIEAVKVEEKLQQGPSIIEAVKRRREAKEASCEAMIPNELKKARTNKENEPSNIKPKQSAKTKARSKINHSEPKPREAVIRKQIKSQVKDGPTAAHATKAAALAEGIMKDPEKAKALLLQLTLNRETSRVVPNTWPPRKTVIPVRFKWANYPPLEAVLTECEEDYYQLSIHQVHSEQQLTFNNRLVRLVKETASEHGLEFDSHFSDDKNLRDRIRDYYKNHTMDSKKRLMTMISNPTKPSHTKRLCELLDFLEQLHKSDHQGQEKKPGVSRPKEAEHQLHKSDHQEQKKKPAISRPKEEHLYMEPPKDGKEWALPSHAAQRASNWLFITLCDAESIL